MMSRTLYNSLAVLNLTNLPMKTLLFWTTAALSLQMAAQQPEIQYFRYRDQRGVNVFETTKKNDVRFDGVKVRIGGNFAQQFQAMTHSNGWSSDQSIPALYKVTPGFNNATANLNFDVQLEDGIRVSLENYMSARHHNEFWVKGGYIQMDKLPFLGNPDWYTNHFTTRIGHFQPNYGDMQFRRSDNGNAMYNPFIENSLMDAFTTEIGGDLRYESGPLFAVVGMTAGLISGDIADKGYVKATGASDSIQLKKGPSVLAKIGYDERVSDEVRVRLTASIYHNALTSRNTLYAGDRAGSRYYMMLEPAMNGAVASTATTNFTSGRINPGFTNQVTAVMINPFVELGDLELFGMIEFAQGASTGDLMNVDGVSTFERRAVSQYMAEALYRFADDQFYIGGRYNTASGQFYTQKNYVADASLGNQRVDRFELGGGWFMTKNLLIKAAYINQNYKGFDLKTAGLLSDVRNNGAFNGVMLEAVVGF